MGKWHLLFAAIEQGLLWLAIIGAINSAIALASYWSIIRTVYLTPAQTEEPLVASPPLTIALGATVAGVLLIGLLPGPLMTLVQAAAPVFFGR
jgi:NADH-quinone oxidoreductase subunit N